MDPSPRSSPESSPRGRPPEDSFTESTGGKVDRISWYPGDPRHRILRLAWWCLGPTLLVAPLLLLVVLRPAVPGLPADGIPPLALLAVLPVYAWVAHRLTRALGRRAVEISSSHVRRADRAFGRVSLGVPLRAVLGSYVTWDAGRFFGPLAWEPASPRLWAVILLLRDGSRAPVAARLPGLAEARHLAAWLEARTGAPVLTPPTTGDLSVPKPGAWDAQAPAEGEWPAGFTPSEVVVHRSPDGFRIEWAGGRTMAELARARWLRIVRAVLLVSLALWSLWTVVPGVPLFLRASAVGLGALYLGGVLLFGVGWEAGRLVVEVTSRQIVGRRFPSLHRTPPKDTPSLRPAVFEVDTARVARFVCTPRPHPGRSRGTFRLAWSLAAAHPDGSRTPIAFLGTDGVVAFYVAGLIDAELRDRGWGAPAAGPVLASPDGAR